MDEQQLFRQLEKVTSLGILLFIGLILLAGIGMNDVLTENPRSSSESIEIKDCGTKPIGTSAEFAKGKMLFLENCASCHNNDMKTDMTGPALAGVQTRWKKYGDGLYKWIQNAPELIASGNPKAVSVQQWSTTEMPAFEKLDTTDISAILNYIEAKFSY